MSTAFRRVLGLQLALALVLVVLYAVQPNSDVTAARADSVTTTRVGSAAGAVTDPAARAWQWLSRQLGPTTDVTSASTVTATRTYPTDWTGAVTGSFVPRGVTSPVTDTASLAVDRPTRVDASYAGVVEGHVTVPTTAGRWIVQAYRDTPTGRRQVPVQAQVDPQGRFAIDLGRATSPPAGRWALGLLDADHAFAPYGTAWPSAVYRNWVVRASVVTDATYPVDEQPARADGTFSFPTSRPGTKIFQLVDRTSGTVLAEQAPDYGLVRSVAGSDNVYAYDQALAVVAALAAGHPADDLVQGLIRLQRPDGGFVEVADVRNPAAAAPVTRTGICAIATYALLRAARAVPAADRADVLAAARSGVRWLLAQQRDDGLLGAGHGERRDDGTVDADAHPGWVSTEHNLDAWQTLHLATAVLPDTDTDSDGAVSPATVRQHADELRDAIVDRLWDAAAGRFRQGIAPDGTPDTADPLDVNSWGALFLHATGHDELAELALRHTAAFASSARRWSGYRAYYPQAAFPDAPANVWAEGTAGVAVAQQRVAGSDAGSALAALAQLQRPDGSLPCAAVADDRTGMTAAPCVAAAAWFVLATVPDGIWG
ncbi:hypothetical protein SAMN05443575_0253 [Jatrophihabitans endophyticus]|uniref:Glucoamylase (Glucan-1,4-alpha-glucosidase), GH15 family n=1 Tax=Jatrophihabitans endophyticus TaxID=1206085 RepID=A0A1M5CI77_9ACTN|nr:hypothetical protein [Jatrophihabitans endophyticus]SHF54428.1 hypothetical protein SAMN05443575_0253 [Jatrophihabitans endophyticus]